MTWDERAHPRDRRGRFTDIDPGRLMRLPNGRYDLPGRSRGAYDEHGRKIPAAMLAGYTRAGDHPEGLGRPGSVYAKSHGESHHPLAGGLWIDPANPGTRHQPRYVNDLGLRTSAGMKPKARSVKAKEDMVARRTEDWSGTPDGQERRGDTDGGKIGYRQVSAEWHASIKRKRARARVERGGHDVWLLALNGQIERRRGR